MARTALKHLVSDKIDPATVRNIGYARVSTADQPLDLQIDALKAAGVHPDDIYVEKLSAVSKKRPQLDLAIKCLQPGDTILVWRLDRIARNMRNLYERLDQIYEQGADFKSLTENFDFRAATGKLILGFLGLMADFERQLTIERTTAGMKALKDRGGFNGRPAKFGPKHVDEAWKMLKAGKEVADIATKFKVSKSTIYTRFELTWSGTKRIVKRREK